MSALEGGLGGKSPRPVYMYKGSTENGFNTFGIDWKICNHRSHIIVSIVLDYPTIHNFPSNAVFCLLFHSIGRHDMLQKLKESVQLISKNKNESQQHRNEKKKNERINNNSRLSYSDKTIKTPKIHTSEIIKVRLKRRRTKRRRK